MMTDAMVSLSPATVSTAELSPLRAATRILPAGRSAVGERRGLLLRLRDQDGVEGVGEASPLPGYSPDRLEDCRSALEAWSHTSLPVRFDEPLLPQVRSALEQVPASLPAARFAVETALLDWMGRRTGRSVADLLCGAGRTPSSTLPLTHLAQGDRPCEILDDVDAALRAGYGTIKLKVGRTGSWISDLAMIDGLRACLGWEFKLRLDANQAWSRDEAVRRLQDLAPFGVELVEEPTSAPIESLPPSGVAVAADESLQEWDRRPALREWLTDGCGALILKPMALGGSLRCLDLAEEAAASQVPAAVTHLFDGTVAGMAQAHLAAALPAPIACGLGPHDGWAMGPAAGVPAVVGADLVVGNAPGLGGTQEP
jgi:o-succinylbenzoate synthase